MDQSEIDALMKAAGKGQPPPKAAAKAPAAEPKPVPKPQPPPEATAPKAQEVKQDGGGQVISEIDAVTAVTERETNKVMDQLDLISQLLGKQQGLVRDIMEHPAAQDPAIQQAIHQVMSAGKEMQDKVFEAMDLMQFQDITRQKLERIVYHLRQIHDYIVDLLGAGLKSEAQRASISRTIAQTGTVPDEKKAVADAVVEEFLRAQQKPKE